MPEDCCGDRLIEVQDVSLVGERLMLLHHGIAHILRGRIKQTELERWTWLSVELERAYVYPNVLQSNWYHFIAELLFQAFLLTRDYPGTPVILTNLVPGDNRDTLSMLMSEFGCNFMGVDTRGARFEVASSFTYRDVIGRIHRDGELNEHARGEFSEYIDCLRVLADRTARTAIGRRVFSTRRPGEWRVSESVHLVEKTFEKAGFEVLYFGDMDVREQMAVMAGTELLAGFHGANLINLLFMPPGASVVEINSSGIPHNLYEGMADVAGLQYRRIMISEPELENEENRVLLAADAACR